ncbi:MAG TPA: hypothetical protein VK348_08865, partial [Planctomycetota bacterium]|nr:hypothetical protein [Planctomycetota bacterium]
AAAPLQPASWEQLSAACRWRLHEAGLGSGDDVELALLGTFTAPLPGGGELDDDLPALLAAPVGRPRAGNVALLRELLQRHGSSTAVADLRLSLRHAEPTDSDALPPLAALVDQHPDAMLPGDELRRARIAAARALLWACDPADAAAVARAAAAAAALGHFGCPAAELQAALALTDRIGEQQKQRTTAVACALAIDPLLAAAPPRVLAELFDGVPAAGPLEGIAVLAADKLLVNDCTGQTPAAVAWRARFPSRCAAALLRAAATRGLTADETTALRELADPFVLREAGRELPPGGTLRDLIALWRRDLPMPAVLLPLQRGGPADRIALLEALAGRLDRRSITVLADLLQDDELPVRTAAAAALFRCVGDRVAYDPEWPETERRAAAERLRALHNRRP